MAQNKAVEAFNANVDALIARLQHAKALAAEALRKPGSQDKQVRNTSAQPRLVWKSLAAVFEATSSKK